LDRTTHKTLDKNPCLDWDSKSQSVCTSDPKPYIPKTVQLAVIDCGHIHEQNKIGKEYPFEYTDFPKVFFTPHQ
jgi:hypothetical protein